MGRQPPTAWPDRLAPPACPANCQELSCVVRYIPEFVVVSEFLADREVLRTYRDAHLAYLSALKAEGKLSIAGPFTDGQGGMYILSAQGEAEARRLAEGDPYQAAGLRSFVVRSWECRL